MSNDIAHGTYRIDGDTIKLNFDTNSTSEIALRAQGDSTTLVTQFPNIAEKSRPLKLLHNNGKLWFINNKDHIKRTALGYRKQFLLFGPRKLTERKFYLRPVENEWKLW